MKREWIAPGRTALLVVDMQVDFAAPGGAMGQQGLDMAAAQAATDVAAGLAAGARRAGVPVVFVRLITRDTDDQDFLREFWTRRGVADPPLCREGTPGAAFAGPQPQGGELVFSKARYSGFAGTGLDAYLKGESIDTLVVAGLTTECCVESTVRDAFERSFHVIVAGDATAAYDAAAHRAALKAMADNCAVVAEAHDILVAWK